MTVGNGPESATAAALMVTLDRDSGYGTSIADEGSVSGEARSWHPGLSADQPMPPLTPADPGGMSSISENDRRQLASHVHQLYYNQNRAALGRQITRTVEMLKALQLTNSSWPAQYPSTHEPEVSRLESRPAFSQTQSSGTRKDLRRLIDDEPLRPGALRRAATTLGEGSALNTNAESSATPEDRGPKEPERLVTPQSVQQFSVLKLNMNVQGLSQAEIAHSMKKESIASLLDGKINQSIRHLLLLRDRIEDTSSKVLITGDLNAGKSTFCNALLRRKILPEDQQPCTSIFCEVLDAKENGNLEEAHAVPKGLTYNRNDESTYDVYRLEDLEKVVTDNEHYTQCKIYVKDSRSIDESLLNNGVVDIALIDAPGLNSDSLKTTAVFARQEEIDVVVFVVSAANHFTLSAKEFIWNAAHEKAYLFIVVNGFDNIRDKNRCERMILEQVAGLSPRTFKESSELVHFVTSNAVPVAPAISNGPGGDNGPGGRGGGSGSGSGSGSGPSDDFPNYDDNGEDLGKHGEPGSPPEKGKGKGKDKEKMRDFEKLESSLRRFVLEKRSRSKLAPARTYLLNLLADMNMLATVNRDIAQSELDRAVNDLMELEQAFKDSKKARSEVDDQVDETIEATCSEIYKDTRTIISNAIMQASDVEAGIPYPGFMGAWNYGELLRLAMINKISRAVSLCEEKAKSKTITSVNMIKSLGILHLGDEFSGLEFKSDRMFKARRDQLSKSVDFETEISDFFDFNSLWESQENKVAGTSMALTVAGVVGGRMVGSFGWVDGTLGAVRILGVQNIKRLVLPGLALSGRLNPYAHAIPLSCFPLLAILVNNYLTQLQSYSSHRTLSPRSPRLSRAPCLDG